MRIRTTGPWSRSIAVLAVGLSSLLARDARALTTLAFSAAPVTTTPGAPVTLTWTATDATACTAAGGWSGPRPTAGSEAVTPAVTTTYQLACDGPSGGASKSLTVTVKGDECEQLSTCVIASPSGSCLYTFDAVDQQVVRIAVHPDASLATVWRLLTSDGMPASDCGVDRPLVTSSDCGPLAAGSYTLLVSSTSGTGSATVGIQQLTACNDTRLDCDQEAVDAIDPGQDSDLFRFSAGEGEIVRLTTKRLTDSVQPEWRLLTAAGVPAVDCATFRAGRDDCGPLPAGDYQVQVRDKTTLGTGTYTIHLQRLTAAAACDGVPLVCDQPVSGEIDPGIDGDLFTFSAGGEMVRVTIEATGGTLVPEWRLLTADGAPAPVCGSFTTVRGTDCGPLAGDYEIEVKDDTLVGTGPYTVNLQRLTLAQACDSTPIICDQTLDGHVDAGGDSDLFRFPVDDQERVHVAVDALDGTLVPAWRLLTKNGTPASACGTFTLLRTLDCGPLAADEYQVQVKDENAVNAGSYEVTVTNLVHLCPNCGNGILTPGEQCDPPGPCCTSTCQFAASGTVCRPPSGDCDVAETCTGAGAACPVDDFKPDTATCRLPAGVCDLAENCTGGGPTCPLNAVKSASSACRPAAGPCDAAEFCSGSGVDCPPDAKGIGVCRAVAGVCDVAERCDGVADDCPPDVLLPATSVCRPAAHVCDVAELCTGTSPACPPNLLLPGACGNGCVDPGEQCGEAGLSACPAGTTCVACACASCAAARLACPQPPAKDGGIEVDLSLDVGSRALGAWAGDLAWDPGRLRLDAILGGTAPEFSAAPTCTVDAATGRASCTATQTSRSDGPTGTVQVARLRMTALGSSGAEVRVTLTAAADPTAAPIPVCAPDAACTVPQCTSRADCEDDDPCTVRQCTAGVCTPETPPGFDAVDCELGRLLAGSLCGGDPVDAGLDRLLQRRVTKARRTLAKAKSVTDVKKRNRLLRRVDRQLGAVLAKAHQSLRRERITPACGDTFDRLLGERRQMVAGLST